MKPLDSQLFVFVAEKEQNFRKSYQLFFSGSVNLTRKGFESVTYFLKSTLLYYVTVGHVHLFINNFMNLNKTFFFSCSNNLHRWTLQDNPLNFVDVNVVQNNAFAVEDK